MFEIIRQSSLIHTKDIAILLRGSSLPEGHCSELANFGPNDGRVVLSQLVLMLALVVEVTGVILSVAVLGAEHVLTFAGEPEEAYLLLADPADLLVGLNTL